MQKNHKDATWFGLVGKMMSATNPARSPAAVNGRSSPDQDRFVRTTLRVLYLSSANDVEPARELLIGPGYELVPVAARQNALALIRTKRFDAVVIADEIAAPEILDFIAIVQRAQPQLPVFLFNDWVAKLLAALEWLEMLECAGQTPN
jgi:hypothetical protein